MITTFIITAAIGVILCVLGAVNTTGNISSLHSYHRHKVSEEDRKPFGRLVGLGTIIIGLAVIAFSAFFLLFELTQTPIYTFIGMTLLFAGIIAGLIISFYAMNKYNGGIF